MELSHWDKKEQAPLVEFLGASLLSHPLMMYYCPDRDKREKFITRYMEHNLPRWIQTGTVLVSDPAHAVGVLLPKNAPEYRSPSKGALSMLSVDHSRRIQSHRNVTRNIVGVMIPREKPVQVLTLFGTPPPKSRSFCNWCPRPRTWRTKSSLSWCMTPSPAAW